MMPARGALYYRYTHKPHCGFEKIRIAIRFGDERLFHARHLIITNYLSIRSESRDNLLPPAN